MENFFRKYGWTVTLGFIAIGALLLALMANNILASKLAPYTVPELPEMAKKAAHKPDRRVQRTQARTWDRAISQLCLFGCPDNEPKDECPGGCPDGQTCDAGQCVPAQDQPVDSDVPVLSDLNMKLLGAMVANPNEYSMALIRDEDSNETLVASPGDQIASGAELVEIRRDRVILERNGRREYIRMDKSIGGDPSATPVSTLPSRRPAINTPSLNHARPSPKASGDAVKRVGNDQYEVSREAMDKQLEDRESLARQGRVVPNFKNGKRNGLKLVGISPNSVYSQLGIQSGDVIHAVNGNDIRTSQQAMELFDKMREEGKVAIEIERRGQKHKLEYKIH